MTRKPDALGRLSGGPHRTVVVAADPLGWLPPELEPVALRLARVDECAFMIGDLSSKWALDVPLTLEHVRRGNEVDAVLRSIRPIPPLVSLLFSEAVGHLRAAIDNTLWYLVELRQGALKSSAAQRVTMPIKETAQDFDNWLTQSGKVGLRALGHGSSLGERVRSLQPFASAADGVPAPSRALALLMGLPVEAAHPLRLLQTYSNHDKHRAIRVATARTSIRKPDEFFVRPENWFKALQVGDVVERGAWGEPVGIKLLTGVVVERAKPFSALVNPAKELCALRRYVSERVIPVLVTGQELPHSPLPASAELGDNGRSARERLCGGGGNGAEVRLSAVVAKRYAEATNREAHVPDVVDDPGELPE